MAAVTTLREAVAANQIVPRTPACLKMGSGSARLNGSDDVIGKSSVKAKAG